MVNKVLLKVSTIISILTLFTIITFNFSFLVSFTPHIFAKQSNCFYASLAGKNEVPPKDTKATGFVELNNTGNNSMSYKINVTDIKKVTSIHLHDGKTGENGPSMIILFKTDFPVSKANGILSMGNITSENLQIQTGIKNLDDLINLINKGDVYVHAHTGANPQGEIRGQLVSCNTR